MAAVCVAVSIMPAKVSFSVDNVRVCKILGSGILQSQVLHGMVFKRQVEGTVTKATKAKVVVYSCPLDAMQTETKVSVRFVCLFVLFIHT
jgi:T-complex protein 1 subunit theta